ncbi:7590_t:CDS:2, partial [Entrophospora sp. SA101]
MLNLPPLINDDNYEVEEEEEEITVIRNVPRELSSVDEVFEISAIHQLQTNGVLFVGEVTSSAEKGNVFKNCNDLTRVGIFMKDCIDSAVDKGADVKVL